MVQAYEMERFARQAIARMATWAAAHADFNLPADWPRRVVLKCSFSHGRSRSRGGVVRGAPWVNLALLRRLNDAVTIERTGQPVKFNEYAHIERDREIGEFMSDDWRKHVAAICAHELAHAIQHTFYHRGQREYQQAHGKGFQRIYRALRREHVNGATWWAVSTPVKPQAPVVKLVTPVRRPMQVIGLPLFDRVAAGR